MKKKLFFYFIIIATLDAFTQSSIIGVTHDGGDGFGTIFKTDGDGNNQQVLSTFLPIIPGAYPNYTQLFEASNGKMYGMTSAGGANTGVIFEYDYPTNTYTSKIYLLSATGNNPHGRLMQASNGKLYGMTYSGGMNNVGVIFEYDYSTNTYTKKIDLDSAKGSNPYGSLIQGANGKLYGMTYSGGASNVGVVFEYDYTVNTFTKKIDLSNINGSKPFGSLIEASNGKLYGMTYSGGGNNEGVIFEYDYSVNTFTKKIDLSNINGGKPFGSLIEASNGKLYGMTYSGGGNNIGVIFEYDHTTNTYTKKINLNATNGSKPNGSLIEPSGGKLYGMTSAGGASNVGVIFEYDYTTNIFTKKIDLSTANGSKPTGSLAQASSGKMYGMTPQGGVFNSGVIFEYNSTSNIFSKQIDLNSSQIGRSPEGSLIEVSNGKMYGTTHFGGANDRGVIFEYDYTTDIHTKKIDLDSANGSYPYSALIKASNGKLYGMTLYGGANNLGVIFEYNYVTNTYTKKKDLNSSIGSIPVGSLIQASNGKLYGMTYGGGVNNGGVIFEYNYVTNIYTKKIDLGSNGVHPYGSLIEASNGKLYGMTHTGIANDGAIFEYDYSSNVYTKKIDLSSKTGCRPYGSLTQAYNGKLYGMTHLGGADSTKGVGVIFEYDYTSNTYTKKIDLSLINGCRPYGSLMQASNGKLYGMTYLGGTNNAGVIFEYDYSTNTYNKKLDFDGINGNRPSYNQLIEVFSSLIIISQPSNISACVNSSSIFSIVAGGLGLTYQWQLNSGAGFSNLTNGGIYSGVSATKLTITGTTAGMNNYQYRCLISSSTTPYLDTSNIAVLSIINTGSLTINMQPIGAAICPGDSTSFSVDAVGSSISYRWQQNSGTGFTDINNSVVYSGVNTETLSIANTGSSMNTYQYRCVISALCTPNDTSNIAVLTINPSYNQTVSDSICSGNFYTLPSGTQVNSGGTYIDTLTSITSCDSMITTYLSVNACTGLDEENNFNHLDILQNSNNGNFSLEIKNTLTLTIYNILGDVVLNETTLAGKKNIDISHLPNGIYLLSMTTNDQQYTAKIIKQ